MRIRNATSVTTPITGQDHSTRAATDRAQARQFTRAMGTGDATPPCSTFIAFNQPLSVCPIVSPQLYHRHRASATGMPHGCVFYEKDPV